MNPVKAAAKAYATQLLDAREENRERSGSIKQDLIRCYLKGHYDAGKSKDATFLNYSYREKMFLAECIKWTHEHTGLSDWQKDLYKLLTETNIGEELVVNLEDMTEGK